VRTRITRCCPVTSGNPDDRLAFQSMGFQRARYSCPVRLSRAERERVFAAVADERRSIANLIDTLNPNQLATASLCAEIGRASCRERV